MKPILFKIITTIIFILLPFFCVAELSISEAINRIPTEPVPFNATKTTRTPRNYSYGLVNPNNAIPDKLYDNVQLTQYTSAVVAPELGATLFRKFSIPNSNKVLIVVSFGNGYGGSKTNVLCVVNPDGTIVSTLEGTVMGCDVHIKQFRITAQNQIIVTTIKPTSTTSIPFETFTSFYGCRQDITYSINDQGQFAQNSIQIFQPQTYARTYLEDVNYNLWEGRETLQ